MLKLLQLLLNLFKQEPTNTPKQVVEVVLEEKPVEVKMGISLKEIIKTADFNKLDKQTQDNLMVLLERINKIRTAYNKPMIVTSGLRTMEDHLRIYKQIAERNNVPFDQSKVPMGSQHLKGAAVDISDPKQELQKWVKDNIQLLEEVGLWCEHFDYTSNWVHFQCHPPKSGNRFFKP